MGMGYIPAELTDGGDGVFVKLVGDTASSRIAGLADDFLVAGQVGCLVDGTSLVCDAPILDVSVSANRVAPMATVDVLVTAHHHLRGYVYVCS